MPVCIRSHQVSQGSFQRESFADLPCWILCAKLFLHDFEYQQRYEADEEVRLDALRERRRRHRHALQQRQETDKSTATRSRLQLTPDNIGGQAIVWHAPRERRRWHWHAPTHLHFRLRFGKENRASSFLSTHLALSFQKIGCGSETQNQINLFCASLILHYLCSYFHF